MDGHDPIAAPTNDLVVFVCADGRHVDIGRARPDGSGHLTLRDGAWAYCAAGSPTEPHTWVEISPRLLPAISHEHWPDQEATS